MKKSRCLLALLALVLPLAGCAQGQEAPPDTSGDPWGFALTVSEAWPTGCTLVYIQSGGEEIIGALEYGAEFRVEREEDGIWTEAPLVPSDYPRAWMGIAYEIPMDSSRSSDLDWSHLYGELPAGHYRIVKRITDFRGTADYDTRDYYAEFEIK